MDYNKILIQIAQEVQPLAKEGKVADYIPELGNVNPDQFGMCLTADDGQDYVYGDSDVKFSIQSISKVFTTAMAFSLLGEKVWERVGVEPSGTRFNSIIQLEIEHGKPRNPLINAGALVMSDILCSKYENPEQAYLEFLRALSGDEAIDYCEAIAHSERDHGFRNAAIANMLKSYDNFESDINRVLDFYFLQCSVKMSCRHLAHAFSHFTYHNRPFDIAGVRLTKSQVKRINAIMQTCGLYDEAGEFAFRVGLPAKSGVGGGISAICPGNFSITVWSPRLGEKGNSVMGFKALELLTTYTEESIF